MLSWCSEIKALVELWMHIWKENEEDVKDLAKAGKI